MLAAIADGAAAKLIVVGLHRGQPIGRVAKLRLRGARLCSSSNCDLLPRLGQHRLQLLIVAIERGGPLLILLRLLRHRRLLLRRKRHRPPAAVRRCRSIDSDCSHPAAMPRKAATIATAVRAMKTEWHGHGILSRQWVVKERRRLPTGTNDDNPTAISLS